MYIYMYIYFLYIYIYNVNIVCMYMCIHANDTEMYLLRTSRFRNML